jgi:hypothetical protein
MDDAVVYPTIKQASRNNSLLECGSTSAARRIQIQCIQGSFMKRNVKTDLQTDLQD